MSWDESLIESFSKKVARGDCSNHCEINLVPLVTKTLALILLRRLTPIRKSNAANLKPGFTLAEIVLARFLLFPSYPKHAIHTVVRQA